MTERDSDDAKATKAPSRLRVIRGKEFDRRLQDAILAANISQSDLARMTGLGRDSISNYVRGRSIPSPRSLDKLAKALHLRREDLQPGANRDVIAPGRSLTKMYLLDGNPEMAWLVLHQKIPTSLALKIIEMVKSPSEQKL